MVKFTACGMNSVSISTFSLSSVSGDANFSMKRTALTVGGFTQPQSAKALIELPSSLEKGLTQRILWMFPQPCFSDIEKFEIVDVKFQDYIGKIYISHSYQRYTTAFLLVEQLSSIYKDDEEVTMLDIPLDCEIYFKKHNSLQQHLCHLSVLDELLSGVCMIRLCINATPSTYLRFD